MTRAKGKTFLLVTPLQPFENARTPLRNLTRTHGIDYKLINNLLFKYCVFSKILKYIPNTDPSRFPLGVSCVHNGRSNTSTASELAELRKITTF